jgi:hypothetical protein
MRRSQRVVPQTLTLVESPAGQRPGTPEVAPPGPSTRQVPPTPSDAQMSDQSSSSIRLSRSQKFRAKKAAKKQAMEAQEQSEAHLVHVDATAGAS